MRESVGPAGNGTDVPLPGRDLSWIREVLSHSGIRYDDAELAAIVDVYAEYERLIQFLDAFDLPASDVPATVMDLGR